MSYENSVFKEQIKAARKSLAEFGKVGVKVVRSSAGSTPANSVPDFTQDQATTETIIGSNFIGIIFPLKAKGSEITLQESYTKQRLLLTLETNADIPSGGISDFLRVGDLVKFPSDLSTFKIELIQTINPDSEFPILWDCVVS